MAKEKETEKQTSKLDAKIEKAQAKKDELHKEIKELKEKILEEKDEKEKKKLRKQRDELIEQLDGIIITDKKVKVPLGKKAKKGITACVAIVCVCALVFGYVATGLAKHGVLSSLGVPQNALTGMVLTDADGETHAIKVSTYNYYFAVYYNNLKQSQQYYSQYGVENNENVDFDKAFAKQTTEDEDGNTITWSQKAEDAVLHNIKDVYSYYYAAVKANKGKAPEITEDQKTELQETLDSYKESADKNGFTLDAYLTAVMGNGVTEATFRNEAEISYIADNYQTDYKDELAKKEYTDKDYNKYLEEHRDELVSVDVKYFEADSEDKAKAFVKELNDDGSNFAELAVKYAKDEDKEMYKDEAETTYKDINRSVFINPLNAAIAKEETTESDDDNAETEASYPGLDWLYSKKRKAGDKKNFSTSVVYVIKPVNLSEVKTVNVRHILIQPQNTDEEGKTTNVNLSEATKKQKKAAKKKADEVLAEYNKGEKTEDAFAALAKKYSTDGNASTGGIYENVVPNQMVTSFNDWCFDSSRKTGDVEIVETEFGYHIIYFVSEGDLPAWKFKAAQALSTEESTSAFEELEKKVSITKSYPGAWFFEIDTDIDN